MATYRIKLSCGNCSTDREYEIERGTTTFDADLICPNCGCCPTESDFIIYKSAKLYGKAIHKEKD